MAAADAAESDRAGPAASGDVARLAASAVGNGDLADGHPHAFGIEEGVGVAPDPLAVAVELHQRDVFDGVSAAAFADALWRWVVSMRRWSSSSRRTLTGTPASAWRCT